MRRQTLMISVVSAVVALGVVFGCASRPVARDTAAENRRRDIHPAAQKVRKDLIRSQYKKGEVAKLCTRGLDKFAQKLKNVQNAFDFDWELANFSDEVGSLYFMAYVHTNAVVRDEASACEEKYNKVLVEIFSDRELYKKVAATKSQNPAEKRLIGELKRKFEKNGMALDDEQLAKMKALATELAALQAQFSKNLNEDKSKVLYTAAELKGLSKDFMDRLKKEGDLYAVTTKTTDYMQVMENAVEPETRRKMLSAYENRVAEANTKLLEKAIVLRQEIAKIMKFKTWADYQIDGRMAQNAKKPLDLISSLRDRLRPRLDADLGILLKAKREMEDSEAKKLMAWDVRYFENQVKKRDYSLDDEVIREYFPKDTVMAGLFDLYSTLFGVRYEEVKGAKTWTRDTKLYAIRDKSNESIVGYFYTDFIPREGKYGHAAAFPLIAGRILKDGSYSQPVAAIVANFTPPTGAKPSLLNHNEVETLFHEFGHIMHQTLTTAPYAFLSGSSTAQDFVEAPSQMLENWIWDPAILNEISGHYSDPKRKLPKEIVTKLIAARDFNQGYFYSRQIMLGLTDLRMHMASEPVDVTALFRKTFEETMTIAPIEDTHFVASFGHMMGGYDAGYYGYIWSEVYAADMFTRFEDEGLKNGELGRLYRDVILAQGAMAEPLDLLRDFLGRAPSERAFLKRLGL